jgi:integrase
MRRTKGADSVSTTKSGKVRVRVEIQPINGKRQWLSAVVDRKDKDATLKKLRRQRDDALLQQKASKDRLETQIPLYLNYLASTGYKGGTILSYKYSLNSFAKTVDKYISAITPKDVSDYLYMRRDNVSAAKAKADASCISCFFNWCVMSNILSINPAQHITFNRKATLRKIHKRKIDVLTHDEHERIKAFLLDKWRQEGFLFYPIYCLAYETGMRAGEVLALQWEDIDFINNTVTVSHTYGTDAKTLTHAIIIPKTASAYRTIKISEKTTKLLAELKTMHPESPFVCCSPKTNALPMCHYTLYSYFSKALKGVGITRYITFHTIRHTNATNMIYKGVALPLIAERLGHASPQITYDTYAHVLKELGDQDKPIIEA